MTTTFEKNIHKHIEKLPKEDTIARARHLPTLVDIDLEKLNTKNSTHSPEEKVHAVMIYRLTGSSVAVEKLTGVNAATLRGWKKSPWWNHVNEKITIAKQEELDGKLTALIDLCLSGIFVSITKGDPVIDRNGEEHYIKPKGKELAAILATLHDKRANVRGEATLISKTLPSDPAPMKSVLLEIKNAMEKIGENKRSAMVIDNEAEDAEFTE